MQSGNAGDSASMDAFAQTRWSLVAALRAGNAGPDRNALEELSANYWYPVYAYIRRVGSEPEPAWHLARRFFDWLGGEIRRNQPSFGGRFRVFMLSQLEAFLASDASRRPPSPAAVASAPTDLDELERRLAREDAGNHGPASTFERSFGLQLIARSHQRLAEETLRNGREAMYAALAPYLTVEPDPTTLSDLARGLRMGTLAVQLAIKHLRHRFREIVEQELAETVSSSADLQAEREALLAVLSRRA